MRVIAEDIFYQEEAIKHSMNRHSSLEPGLHKDGARGDTDIAMAWLCPEGRSCAGEQMDKPPEQQSQRRLQATGGKCMTLSTDLFGTFGQTRNIVLDVLNPPTIDLARSIHHKQSTLQTLALKQFVPPSPLPPAEAKSMKKQRQGLQKRRSARWNLRKPTTVGSPWIPRLV